MQHIVEKDDLSVEEALSSIERAGTNVCIDVGGVIVFSGKWPDDKDSVFLSRMLLKTYTSRILIVNEGTIEIFV